MNEKPNRSWVFILGILLIAAAVVVFFALPRMSPTAQAAVPQSYQTVKVEKGRGYVSVEMRQKEKLPIGVIAVDAAYSPVRLVNFNVEDVRVGQRIDFNKVTMEVQTDGSVQPEAAMKEAAQILTDHFALVAKIAVPEVAEDATKLPIQP